MLILHFGKKTEKKLHSQAVLTLRFSVYLFVQIQKNLLKIILNHDTINFNRYIGVMIV